MQADVVVDVKEADVAEPAQPVDANGCGGHAGSKDTRWERMLAGRRMLAAQAQVQGHMDELLMAARCRCC